MADMADKKPGLMVAIGMGPKLKKKDAAPPAMDEGEGGDKTGEEMEKSAVSDMSDAIASGDKEAAYAAFKDAFKLCYAAMEAEEPAAEGDKGSY